MAFSGLSERSEFEQTSSQSLSVVCAGVRALRLHLEAGARRAHAAPVRGRLAAGQPPADDGHGSVTGSCSLSSVVSAIQVMAPLHSRGAPLFLASLVDRAPGGRRHRGVARSRAGRKRETDMATQRPETTRPIAPRSFARCAKPCSDGGMSWWTRARPTTGDMRDEQDRDPATEEEEAAAHQHTQFVSARMREGFRPRGDRRSTRRSRAWMPAPTGAVRSATTRSPSSG